MATKKYEMHENYADEECNVAIALIRMLLAKNLLISVFDGDEWVVKKSSKEAAILNKLGLNEREEIAVRADAAGKVVGKFYLAWGEGEDDLISDTSETKLCNEVVKQLNAMFKKETATEAPDEYDLNDLDDD